MNRKSIQWVVCNTVWLYHYSQGTCPGQMNLTNEQGLSLWGKESSPWTGGFILPALRLTTYRETRICMQLKLWIWFKLATNAFGIRMQILAREALAALLELHLLWGEWNEQHQMQEPSRRAAELGTVQCPAPASPQNENAAPSWSGHNWQSGKQA